MTTSSAEDMLRDFPPVVYVPCGQPSAGAPGPDGQVPLELHMRRTRDGRLALLAYSALDRFHDLAGRETNWALVTHEGLDEIYARQPFDLLLMDIAVPEDAREDDQWLTI
ncbi:SAV_915 family protein [Dietzia alimentaria]|uniref:SAV_915 family protein n=1 Tax=Dietzia alimentaria TaxID=665550 RepID=UPI001EE68E75|nr:SAV_915 family protein [Dietzia alimentaria]